MSIDLIPDSFPTRIYPRLMQQYKEASNFKTTLQGECQEKDLLESTAPGFYDTPLLDSAEGPQLDNIGELFVEPRSGRLDADYRLAIKAKMSVRSFATIDSICEVVKAVYGATYARLYPKYPAGFILVTDVAITSAQIEALSGAGIRAESGGYLKTMAGEFLTTSAGERFIVST